MGAGFLELANAGDFAANVWNKTPVPIYATVLMAFGGILALSLICFAIQDACLSPRNMRLLYAERKRLWKERAQRVKNGQVVLGLDTRLDVNFRELGTETITRFSLDILLGLGSLLVGIGTLLAIGGADYTVWKVSNLFSGYLGNSFSTFQSLSNASWCLYTIITAQKHKAAVSQLLDSSETPNQLKRRSSNVQKFAAVSAIMGLIGSFGSLTSVTRWWGYLILISAILSSICCNYFWRHRIGYDHSIDETSIRMTVSSLVGEMESIALMQRILSEAPSPSLEKLGLNPQSLTSVLDFIVSNNLFEDFCSRLLSDPSLLSTFVDRYSSGNALILDSQTFYMAETEHTSRILAVAQTFIARDVLQHFRNQQRYLSETLGSYLRISLISGPKKNKVRLVHKGGTA